MSTLRFNKPYQVLAQFTDDRSEADNRLTLADYISVPAVYAAGRLDRDSEGLLLLTSDGQLQNRISHPDHKLTKTYWVQVEGDITPVAIATLCKGVMLKDGITAPAKAKIIAEPSLLWPRNPPVRFRATIPTSWVELEIREGRNRQVRRMTAAVGFPTLRLIRYAMGPISLDGLKPGEYAEIDGQQIWDVFRKQAKKRTRR